MSLVVVGSMAYDAIETPFGKTDRVLGGAATYISLAASYFIRPVKVISVVGYDFEESDLQLMRAHGVSLEGVEISQKEKTFFWAGKYRNDMNIRDTLATELNVLETFDPKVPESYTDCRFLMLGNLSPEVQRKVIQQLPRRPDLIVLDTMNFWIESALDSLKETLALVDVIIINDEEARMLSHEYSLRRAAYKILGMGPRVVVIKKGEHGALLFNEDEIFSAPGLPMEEVFDPTGAGDTFAGGFAGYLSGNPDLSFQNMKRAIVYGSAMASFCVEKFGPERLASLSFGEIQNRVNQFVRLSNFDLLSREIRDFIDQSA